MATKIFLTGATGYIGGSVLTALLKRGSEFQITVLVRSQDSVAKLEQLGVTPVLGSLSDSDILTKAAADSDVVIHAAESFLVEPVKAIIEGLKQRGAAKGTPAILIQTSGTGALLDSAGGEFASDTVYSDLYLEELRKLPIERSHGQLDLFVSEIPQEEVKTVLIFPSNIYGIGTGQFNRLSVINPALISAAIKRRKVHTVGKGLNSWSNVHIEDVADAYLLLLDKLLDNTAETGRDGFYFAISGEETMQATAKAIADSLFKRGVIEDRTVTPFPEEELETALPYGAKNKRLWGGNSRGSGDRLKKLGWAPSRLDFVSSVDQDVELLLQLPERVVSSH